MKKMLVAALPLLPILGGCMAIVDNMERNMLFEKEGALVRRGETFFGLDGGSCLGPCPVYEIYVFDSGRVIFRGSQYTTTKGVVELHIDPAGYLELGALLKKRRAFGWHPSIGCKTDHSTFEVYDSHGSKLRSAALDYGCDSEAEDIESIEEAFVRISGTELLIRDPNKNAPEWPERERTPPDPVGTSHE